MKEFSLHSSKIKPVCFFQINESHFKRYFIYLCRHARTHTHTFTELERYRVREKKGNREREIEVEKYNFTAA